MKKVLVSAFEPFGGETLNPSAMALEMLKSEIDDKSIVKLLLPVEFNTAGAKLCAAINDIKPDCVVSLGQAGGRSAVEVERVAINVMDAFSPDNAGYAPKDEPIANNAPAAYFATLPIKKMVRAAKDKGMKATVSNSAGTYVCNTVMYSALHHITDNGLNIAAGFIHVPFIPEQTVDKAGVADMPLENIVAAVEEMLRCL